ncbi:hypothetical protein [Billgrantia kenyensis]|uniref:Uncharacterized protein n=1 Tax=Billgrantia kenyensis TaxID=321266 RepID=A0A7V9VYD5_9GAMM|nr:hypothetical protein [Halomonas kenyensis]MBA2777665.1 hypothetical protein [Halomonas kenyensis]MCG6660335.1 hypothetical protein [Halomonas kenyensis]
MMDMHASLLLLPQEQLTLANAHETTELKRYRRLTLSFLPKAPQASRLMASLALQSERRLDTLRRAARSLDLEACVSVPPMDTPSYEMTHRHFFVVDDNMATQLLDQAIRAVVESKHFFDWLLNTNATPELHQPFVDFVSEKENECRVLLEFREQYHPRGILRHA